MANEEQLAILKQGIEVWNKWRQKHPKEPIDLSGADLKGASLVNAKLFRVNLKGADLRGAYLRAAELYSSDLREADLREADLSEADLFSTDFSGADLRGAYLRIANLNSANLKGANLDKADLRGTHMIETQLQGANLSNCRIFGISVWKINLEGATQSNLIITDGDEPIIIVDNLEVAQFIYLLIHNQKLGDVIDTITSKAVLILGRFTPKRKAVLDAMRDELRQRNYIPILFDFEKPASRDVTETVSTLAHMARFVIADLTDAKSIPQELTAIVPNLPHVAVQPLILKKRRPYGMFEHWQNFHWVLPIHEYEDQAQLIAELVDKVIAPAEAKVIELRPAK
ncbi:MAG: pentapeptide repeat-containing protein [Chloroflexota bacterium]